MALARDERSQHRNKALALQQLAALISLICELEAITARTDAHAEHDRLERGCPVSGSGPRASGSAGRVTTEDSKHGPAMCEVSGGR